LEISSLKTTQSVLEILNSSARREFLTKVLSIFIPISFLLVGSGLLTNFISEFNLLRVVLNCIMLLMLIIALYFVRKGKLIQSISLLYITIILIFTLSTLFNGGVRVPNYPGFLLVLMISGTFFTKRTLWSTYLFFVTLGGISLVLPASQSLEFTLPSSFRYWTIYAFFGLFMSSILLLTKEAFNEAINKIANREALLSSVFLSINDPLFIFDSEGKMVHQNLKAKDLDSKLDESPYASFFDQPVLNTNTQAYLPLSAMIELGGQRSQILDINLVLNRQPTWYEVTATPQLLNEKSIGTVVVIRDMTDQYRLAQSQKMSAVGVLANGVAHDFNNMLGAIRNATELLSSSLNQEQLEYLSVIEEATQRSSELTDQLMLFSRERPTKPKLIDLHILLNKLAMLLRRIAVNQNIIELELSAHNAIICGDESQIHSVFMNLGINALQAMPAGGQLKIKTKVMITEEESSQVHVTHKSGSFICVEVEDEGTGISPANQQRIFEPFFTTKNEGEGTGLGLSAVHGTVKSHDGMITVKSGLGEGTTFSVVLPLAEMADQDDEVKPVPIQSESLYSPLPKRKVLETPIPNVQGTDKEGKKKVLIIDDEPLVRRTLIRILDKTEYITMGAESGKVGLRLLHESNDFDLIILDMLMPDRNGREVFADLQVDFSHIPVILSSGFIPEGVVNELKAQGLAGILHKPYKPKDLISLIEQIIQTRHHSKS
jgi:signal transduction histidine kinase/CheY-like chemotaxis protein